MTAWLTQLPLVLYEAVPSQENPDLWRLLNVSDTIEDLTGFPAADFLGDEPRCYLYEMIHPDDRVRIGSEYDRCRITESPMSLRYRIRHRQQGYRVVEERSSFKRDANGLLHSYGALLDSNQLQRESRRHSRLDAALESLNADVAVATGQAFLESLCRRLAYLLDIRQVAIMRVVEGQNLESLARVHDGLLIAPYTVLTDNTELSVLRYQARAELIYDKAIGHGLTNLDEIRHVIAIRLDNHQGEWLGVLVLCHDKTFSTSQTLDRALELYTDRAVTEIERLGLERQLQESDARYRAFFDTAVQPALVINPKGRVTNFNQAARRLFEVGDSDDLQLIDLLPRHQADGRSSLYSLLRLVKETHHSGVSPSQWQMHTLSGRELTVIVYISPTMMNQTERALLTIEDITDRLKSEAVLAEQNRLMRERQSRLRGLVRLATELERQGELHDFLEACLLELLHQEGCREVAYFQWASQRWRHSVGDDNKDDDNQDRHGYEYHALSIDQVMISGSVLLREDDEPWVYMPLFDSGTPVAVLVVGSREAGFRDREFIDLLHQTIALAFDNLMQRLTLHQQAMRDSLTDLGNRAQLHAWVRDTLEEQPDQSASLLLFDLNRFKEINDTLGHHFGDRLLCEIGPRIVDILARDNSWGIARLGGDEFAVFLPQQSQSQALALAELIGEALRQPYLIDSMKLQVEASIGVSHYPTQGRDGHELLRCADVAMYAAKSKGQTVVVFNSDLDASTPQRIAVLSELDQGLQAGHLWVAYQPVIFAADGRIGGLEALVRWRHPELGDLSPTDFIPLAEMGQGIRQITDFVLRTSLAAVAHWRETVKDDLYMAVNLSSRVLLDHALPQQVSRLLKEFNLPGSALVLELTESTLLSDPLRAVDIIEQLAELGVQLEVDDFGTGYSSLAYLKSLPIQALKIDKSFIADLLDDPQDRIIVESTIKMAHNLGLEIIAEGVEDEATLIELVKMECDAIQGFYFSKPLAAKELDVWLQRNL
ncbi:EAL domain-containing protein [Saccharospirillum mangrovi]|uniref:bifunctional diguanylate cyclase/phosphodiesterase n=1 Tax=Saccharospirillum mangrovi TaxID=2161747 RepID=UPI0013B3F2C4|nr:EAL domain-containing protein [Saccharospirillum mangrovi]